MTPSPPSPDSAAPPHVCHARGCDTDIDPGLFMCPIHWPLVSPALRDSIRATYRLGQEVDKQPSQEYLAFAAAAIADVAHKEDRQRQRKRRAPSKPVQLALFDVGTGS